MKNSSFNHLMIYSFYGITILCIYLFMELSFYGITFFMTTNNVKSIYVGASLPAPIFLCFYLLWIYHFMQELFYVWQFYEQTILWFYLFMDLSFYGSIFLLIYLFIDLSFYEQTILWNYYFMELLFYGFTFLWLTILCKTILWNYYFMNYLFMINY